MRTLSPNFVASPMMDTIDLAFALLLPCSRRISDSYFFAAPTKTAAGLACMPAGFGKVTSSETTAPVVRAV